GKWHLDGDGRPQWSPQRKFGFENNRYMFNRGHWKQFKDTREGPKVKGRNSRGGPTRGLHGVDEQSYATDFLADRTIDFIEAHRDKPFCYMISFPDPHDPDTVRPPYDTMFADQEYKIPRTFDVPGRKPNWGLPNGRFINMAKYYGMVKCIDDNVGKIIDALRKNGLIEKTIVVFTSDHGDLRGEHHRQNKGVPYEASARIPFVVYAPGRIEPGTVVREALSCVDFKPTILRLMGLAGSEDDQGRDASALLTQGNAPADWNDVAFIRGTGGEPGWVAAVSDRYKLVYSTNDDPWLFDLQTDPDEVTNYFTDPAYRKVVRDLSAKLAEYGKKYNDPRVANARIRADLDKAIR
ncbi:MAG: sulfatase-like hydrolase/transferase, partial [Pirellulales bacterium]|nr:sulfatase-like hydrolase/transferase [Pirellulales bacterium]